MNPDPQAKHNLQSIEKNKDIVNDNSIVNNNTNKNGKEEVNGDRNQKLSMHADDDSKRSSLNTQDELQRSSLHTEDDPQALSLHGENDPSSSSWHKQYGKPMCVALNIQNQFRWDTRFCSGDSIPSAVCQIPVPSWIRTGECGLGRDWTLDSKLIYYPDNESVSCQCNGASQTICTLQGGLENQDSCCFHKQSKESYVDEMFDNIFQIPKQSEKENNKEPGNSVEKEVIDSDISQEIHNITDWEDFSTNDEHFNSSFEELRDDEIYEDNKQEYITTTSKLSIPPQQSTISVDSQHLVSPVIASQHSVSASVSSEPSVSSTQYLVSSTSASTEEVESTEEYKLVVAATEKIDLNSTQQIDYDVGLKTESPMAVNLSKNLNVQTEDINSESEITTVQYKHLQASTITQTSQDMEKQTENENREEQTIHTNKSVPEILNRQKTPILLAMNRPRRDIISQSSSIKESSEKET